MSNGPILRDYQTRSIHAVFEAWRYGARSVVLVSPTGSGKRILALWLMDYASQANRRVLFAGNRRLLITQAAAGADEHGLDYGIIMADSKKGNLASTNQIASIQTLESWHFNDDDNGEGLPPANLLIIDEAHQDTERYKKLISFYPDAKVLLLTATPVGAEGRSLVPAPYDTLIEPVKNSELVNAGRLLRTVVYAPSEPWIEGVRVVKEAEYNQAALGRAVQSCTVAADVFREWERYQDRATVAFVPGVPYGRHLVDQFNHRYGAETAAIVEAKTPPGEREEIFAKVEAQKIKVLVSVDVLREGFDLPILSCGIDLQPNQQLRSYWQKLGRIKRPYNGQENAVWLDFAGNYWRFPHPDSDPEWPTGTETTQDRIKAARKERGEPQPIMCPSCCLVRERGPVCPGCNYKSSEAIRRIRMENGTLREIPAIEKKRYELTNEDRLLNKWKSRLFGALKSGLTYGQCVRLFKETTGSFPRQGWPGVFERGSLDWKRCPQDEYSPASLMKAFQPYHERRFTGEGNGFTQNSLYQGQ